MNAAMAIEGCIGRSPGHTRRHLRGCLVRYLPSARRAARWIKGIRGLIYPASSDVHGRRILVCDTTLEGVALLRSISIVRRMQF